jgi:hypothetical protein
VLAVFADVGQKEPPERLFFSARLARHRACDLRAQLSIQLDELHVPPRGGTKAQGVVVRISGPEEPVFRDGVPLLAGDLAGLTADADGRIGEESDGAPIGDVLVLRLVVVESAIEGNGLWFHARSLVSRGRCRTAAPSPP